MLIKSDCVLSPISSSDSCRLRFIIMPVITQKFTSHTATSQRYYNTVALATWSSATKSLNTARVVTIWWST